MPEGRRYTNQDLDITIFQGGEFKRKITLNGVNLTGYGDIKATIREVPDARFSDPIEMETAILEPAKGVIQVFMPASETKQLNFRNRLYYWEVSLQQPGGEWRRVLGGRASLVTATV